MNLFFVLSLGILTSLSISNSKKNTSKHFNSYLSLWQNSVKEVAFNTLQAKCNVCHVKKNRKKVFTLENMNLLGPEIYTQVFVKKRMPKGNDIELTKPEYRALKNWLNSLNMKKVVVFGSTGTIGKHIVEQSLEKGYEVLAFCRDKQKLKEFSNSRLKIMEGDVLNLKDVNRAVTGQEVVIVTLGSGKSRTSTVRSEGTKNIIEAMHTNGVSRLICQTTLGTGDSNGNLNFFWKRIMFGWFLKKVFLDHELQESFVKNSKLNWTIIRPSAFTDGEKTGNYLHGFSPQDKSTKLKIARADVADFIVKQITDTKYIHKTPGVSY